MVTFRPARRQDAGQIARVHVESWRATYAGMIPDEYLVSLDVAERTRYWQGLLAREREGVLVVEDAEAGIVGFASAGPARPDSLPDTGETWTGEIYTLYLDQDWHGRGIGRRLIETLFARLASLGMGEVLLWVLEENPTRFFYEAMGGRRVARRVDRFAGAELQEVAYGWHLVPADPSADRDRPA